MTKRTTALLAALFLSACAFAHAQTPAGATGQCKDGTYSNAASKDGACRGHKGVQTWYAATPTTSAKPAAATKTAASVPAATPTAAATSGPAPSGSTGQCKDGSYSSAASKDGACRGHQGVKTWFSVSASTPSKPGPAPASAAAPRPAPAPAAAPTPSPAPARSSMPTQPATGGGPGQVWVNTSTKVYHCSGDRYYGKTKNGAYMSESDAIAKGARPDAGKACPK